MSDNNIVQLNTRGVHLQPLSVVDVYVPEHSTVITVEDVSQAVELVNYLLEYDEALVEEDFEEEVSFITFHLDEYKEAWLRFSDTFWIKYTT